MQSMKQDDVLNMDTLMALPEGMSYAALILDEEVAGREQVITEMMMRRACEIMHDEQQFPFCSARSAAVASPVAAQPCSMNQGKRTPANVHRLDERRQNR